MQALFISDLHLTPTYPAVAQAFLAFLEQQARMAKTLYILGDFFEYWAGDDAMEPFHVCIASALKTYTDAGHTVNIMPGNRDFAIGRQFLKQSGAQWLKDPTLTVVNGEKILLTHGDTLCTEDRQYLFYRRIIRCPLVIKLLYMTSLNYRKKLVQNIQQKSLAAKTQKRPSIMDVTPEEVCKVMNSYNIRTMIHGHTHHPAIHQLEVSASSSAKRYVLGDWGDKGWFISTDNNQLTLESFDIDSDSVISDDLHGTISAIENVSDSKL